MSQFNCCQYELGHLIHILFRSKIGQPNPMYVVGKTSENSKNTKKIIFIII